MKKQISQRLMSMLLVLVMLLGLIPGTMSTRTEAVTPEEQTVAEALLQRINTMETGERFSKYVRVTGFHAPDVEDYPTAQQTLKGLSGYYIVVNADPIEEGSDMHYALNAGKEVAYSNFAVDRVQMVGDQLFGADPKGALYIAYDRVSSEESQQQSFSETSSYTTARARYTLKNREGKHFVISSMNSRVEMRTIGVTTTLYAKYTTGCVRFMISGTYRPTTDEKLGMRFNTTGAVPFVDYGTAYPTFCYLYEEKANRVNVEPLYDAIIEAKAYINNCNPYEEEHYGAFLTALENALNTYPTYNVDSYSGNVATAESTVNDLAQVLREATTLIKPYDEQINELLAPMTQQVASLSEVTTGTYFILGMDRNGFYRTFDPDVINQINNTRRMFNKLIYLPVQDGNVVTHSLLGSSVLHKCGDGYSWQLSNGAYLQVKDNTATLEGANANQEDIFHGNPIGLTILERSSYGTSNNKNYFYEQSRAFLIRDKDITNIDIWVVASNNSNRFQASSGSNYHSGGGDELDLYLFRMSDLTLELFKALEYVEPYGGGNADGRYNETVYAAFAAKVSEALTKYRANRNTMSDTTLQTELDDLAAELKEYAQKLTLADSHASYIDIPLEVLDFRSDRFLFEYYSGSAGNRYALTDAIAQTDYPTDPLLLPLYEAMEANTKRVTMGNYNVRAGMLLPDLVDGNPTYAEHTVGFIAARILKEWMHNPNSSLHSTNAAAIATYNRYLENVDTQDVIWNTAKSFYDAYHAAGKTQTEKEAILGSFDKTVEKTLSGVNGGDLPWNRVTTVFDLAYYALNNIWRPVSDTLGTGKEPYNTVVPERDTLRMYLDKETGLYTIDSANRTVYDGYKIYNTVPFVDNGHLKFPQMIPVNGLGFEKNNTKDTDPTTNLYTRYGWEKALKDVNYGFMLHASGSFVYYEDQEQKFDFVGDDDVYFFINGTLVMDLGGTHNPAGGSLLLSEANTKYNLGLEDEGVYSFDMFYAERHTFGSNMKFSTNIKIVSSDTLTTKGQYAVEVKGNSTIGSDGKGGEMIDNQLLNVGDVVAYSFNLDNTRTAPVQDLEFHDPSLGVHLTKDKIEQYNVTLENGTKTLSLTNPETGYGNGVATRFADLILEYIPYDEDGNRASGTPTELTPAQMATMIRETVTLPDNSLEYHYDSLPTTVYRVRVSNESELMDLLAAGVPKKCYFSIYGFLRKTVSEDVPYANELTTHCSYRRSANISAEFATITGKASRFLRVPEATDMPDIPRIEAVLDYGKAVQIPIADFTNQFFFEKDGEASVGQVVGFVEKGYNGQLLKAKPKTLLCVNTDETAKGTHGIFTRKADVLEYAMGEFMESVELLYAVVQVNNFVNAGVQYEYALVELRLIPANMMYYEAEDFAGAGSEIAYVQVGGSYPNWKIEDDKKGSSVYQDFDPTGYRTYDMVADRDNIPAEAFFADFDGKGYVDRYRTQPQYKGFDFDEYYTKDP
ncbi:MAG: fibro-slime domain-containing protein, partial [Oscillospiraceae bacterium]|nr:fibro-slime domain-containing protein [Oscillospiraceae bacterium]